MSLLIAALAVIAATSGLFESDSGNVSTFMTLRGQEVGLYGRGLYKLDTLFMGAGNRGVDFTILVFAVPLLLLLTYISRRGSIRARLLHLGVLAYLLYIYISMSFAVAYNSLFLLYVVLFSALFYTFIFSFTSIDRQLIRQRLTEGAPQKGLIIFMVASGAITLFVWGEPLVTALVQQRPPLLLDSYTTPVTYGLDLAIITPATFLTAVWIHQKRCLGYLTAVPLFVLIIFLAPQIAAQTIFQIRAGVQLSPGQIIGPISGFVVLGIIAVVLLSRLLEKLSPDHSGSIGG